MLPENEHSNKQKKREGTLLHACSTLVAHRVYDMKAEREFPSEDAVIEIAAHASQATIWW